MLDGASGGDAIVAALAAIAHGVCLEVVSEVASFSVEGLFRSFGPPESGRTSVLLSSPSSVVLSQVGRSALGCFSEENTTGNYHTN